MNIFYLHEDAKICAMMHNDKHCTKMIVEYAQLMSTAHRVLDGEEYYDLTKNGRKIKRWRMDNEIMEANLMKASHVNHPSNQWLRKSSENYKWLFEMWSHLLDEYTYRYGKIHKCTERYNYLKELPINIPWESFAFSYEDLAMYDDVKCQDPIESYRNYYNKYKTGFANWKKRQTPYWWNPVTI